MAKKKASHKSVGKKSIETLTHDESKRTNIPTAELESVVTDEVKSPIRMAYQRRNRDLDPQLVWRGKDEQDWSELVVHAPPLYIQEKVHPKVLIDDLLRVSQRQEQAGKDRQLDLFADFNGLPDEARVTDFYQHDANWTNRMILGDSLQVMASLAEREGLRGQVQCIYIDPPYGIKFNSNFQWSTTNRDVKDGNVDHITREPEQVKAFRDTWRDGIHSYLTYLRDRLAVARDLLSESGSIFVQIGDENVHRVRALLDEVFGESNFISQISTKTSGGSTGAYLSGVTDFVVWYAKSKDAMKFRVPLRVKAVGQSGAEKYSRLRFADLTVRPLSRSERSGLEPVPPKARVYRQDNLTSQSVGRDKGEGAASWFAVGIEGREIEPSLRVRWKTNQEGMQRLLKAHRVERTGNTLSYVRFLDDFSALADNNFWEDIGGIQSRSDPKVYVVQTPTTLIQRCISMSTDPGDLVLDPTCGSGTTPYVAEQWGRRWITIDTSRVALALARARIMGARYPYYLLADSREGQRKEAEVTLTAPSDAPTHGNIRHGFVYERVPHITLKSVANNAEIDVIWDKWQQTLEPLREQLNQAVKQSWEEWEIPREADGKWPKKAKDLHSQWWEARIARQREIDASIAAKAEFEYLYDKPYEDKSKVRVAGPFTVESLSPHRSLAVDENDELVDRRRSAAASPESRNREHADFAQVILENLKTSGVQQAHKEDKISFTSIAGWPGNFVCAEGRYVEGDPESGTERRAGIFIGPEFGTVSRPDLVAAAREAGDAGFDVLIACAFNYDARSSDFDKLGRIPVLKARMNADLHMADTLKNTGQGNLFVIFGEPESTHAN
ncbi:MAG: site-specific DNA-methyltransferase [Pirellulaceae bacterium]|nr:site-specific DNA-methyltransferase [Pirellulaceae bacterium]